MRVEESVIYKEIQKLKKHIEIGASKQVLRQVTKEIEGLYENDFYASRKALREWMELAENLGKKKEG